MAARASSSDAPAGAGAPPASGPRFSREAAPAVWALPGGPLSLDRPRIVGVLNRTPDSFSDGGELDTVEAAVERAGTMVEEGADLLDVGGESTRPGAPPVGLEEELRRVLPVVERLSGRFGVPVSVDTRKAEVARRAVEAGAAVVNDVSGLSHDPGMAAAVADAGVGLVLMHMRGTPRTMERRTGYDDVVDDVLSELGRALSRAREAGIPDERIVLDPGLGFAKTAEQSLVLLRETARFVELGRPVLVGPSRKSFLGAVLGAPPGDRLEGTLAACVIAYAGGARLFRVHDVGPVARALRVARAVAEGRVGSEVGS